MRFEMEGDGELPFRTTGADGDEYAEIIEEDETFEWRQQSFRSRLLTVAVWLFAAFAMAVLMTIVVVFLLFADSDGSPDEISSDSAEGRRVLGESVELENCRYVDRMAERVTVRFTNPFERRLDHAEIQVRFVDGGQAFAEHEVSFTDIAPDEVREAVVRDERLAYSESDPLECEVGWVRVFETG